MDWQILISYIKTCFDSTEYSDEEYKPTAQPNCDGETESDSNKARIKLILDDKCRGKIGEEAVQLLY